jgi:hypothetical protein
MADCDIEGALCARGERGTCRKFSVKLLLRLAFNLGLGGARFMLSESRWEAREDEFVVDFRALEFD